MSELPSERHLRPEGLAQYLESGAAALVPIAGSPSAQLIVNPPNQIGIRLATSGPLPNLDAYRVFSIHNVVDNQARWVQLSVKGPDVLMEAYPLLCGIVDRVQLKNSSFSDAITEVLAAYHHLLARPGRLSQEREVGLFGELLVLEHLIDSVGETGALDAWCGPSSEEHDFGLADYDVEVKTTLAETRRHWISGVRQLEPKLKRPLWLLSLQITAAGIGGLSLPSLIGGIMGRMSTPAVKEKLDQALESAGWRVEQSMLFQDTYRYRSAPQFFEVTSVFPAITSSALSGIEVPMERILKVAYEIDLTGLRPDQGPTELMALPSKEF